MSLDTVRADSTRWPAWGLSSATVRGSLFGLFLLALVATAWVHDDAFISFRTVDNFVAGRGLTWNDGERVQVFTHPLWFFLHAGLYVLVHEIYITTLSLCLLCSVLTVYFLAFRLSACARDGALVIAALLLSQGFLDYSTSGLETPLSHLLIVLIGWRAWPRRAAHLSGLALLTALAGLNRLDLLPLLLPILVLAGRRAGRNQRLQALAVFGLPLLLWEAFSLIYFGFLVPNTAPAKLATGISGLGKLTQGLSFLGSSLVHDGFTVLLGAWLLSVAWRRSSEGRAVAIGVGLYLAYLVAIGGGYMSGRLLTAPYLLLIVSLIRDPSPARPIPRPAPWIAIAVVTLLVRSFATLAGQPVDPVGIGNERRVWHPFTGLVYFLSESSWPEAGWRLVPGEHCDAQVCILSRDTVGLIGYYSGPEVYILDANALADPFRARLPGIRRGDFNLPGRMAWRPGHVRRPRPAGFVDSLKSGDNRIEDPGLARFYDATRLVTRGPLWSQARWREIWRLNTGAYDEAIRAWAERNPSLFQPRDLRREIARWNRRE